MIFGDTFPSDKSLGYYQIVPCGTFQTRSKNLPNAIFVFAAKSDKMKNICASGDLRNARLYQPPAISRTQKIIIKFSGRNQLKRLAFETLLG